MKDKTISLLQFDGEMSAEEMELGFKYILKGAEDIYQKQLEALKSKYKQISDDVKIENVEVAKHAPAELISEESTSEVAPATPETPAVTPADVPVEKPGESPEPVPETPVSEAPAPETPAPEAPKQGDDN